MSRSWDILKSINEFIRFSDTKAGVVLAFAGGSAAYLSNKVEVIRSIIVAHQSDPWGWILYVATLLFVIGLLATLVSAFATLRPMLTLGKKRSPIFFKHIAEDYADDHTVYAKQVLKDLDDSSFDEEMAEQIVTNSKIATKKYFWVDKAILSLSMTGTLWVAIVLIILLLGSPAPK